MENRKDQKINCDMKTDLNLLLECLKYQMGHPASQKEVLVTIYSVCQQNSAACDYFREIGGLMFVWNLAKSQLHSLVQEAALFTLGGLAENNVFCQQMLCTAELFEDLRTFLTNKNSSMNLKRMSVYVLLVLVSNNNRGQTYVRESGCLDILLHLFRVIPSESQMNLFDHKIDQYHLWSSVCSNLCACVNNPQNEENQKACSLVFPYAKDWLQNCMKAEIVRPICSFIGLSTANNSRTQNFFISIGGLAVLDELLLKLIHGSLVNNTNIKLAIVVTKTLDACIADNASVGIHLPKYNIVPNLLKLLSYNILDSGERFSIILTLGHCTEVCEENQYTLVKNNGLPLMIQALAEMQDDELNKAATFVLQNCKQMTEKLSVKINQHSFQMDERRILEADWQKKERILEDYWKEAKQILYKIKGLENEKEENIGKKILIKEDTPQEQFLQALTQHRQPNSSKQPSDNSKICSEMKHPPHNTISKVQNTSTFENSSSSRGQLKSAIWNSAQNDHNLHANEKKTTPSINEAYITNKNSFHGFRKSDAQTSEFVFKRPDFLVKNPMQKIQHSDLKHPRNPSRGVGHILTVCPKIREHRCSGCRIGRLSLNSRNFSKTLQSCQYLCEQHKIILESEMEYKRKLRRSIMANKNTSAYHNGNHDDQIFSYKRNSTTVKELANFQYDAYSKNQTMKQNYSLQDQELSENHPFEEANTETLSNRSATTLKKRRIRKDFTSDEISYLLEGVRKMGHHWNSILWAYPFQKGRTNVDLAKKYSKLQKNEKSRNTQLQ
ncbi:telomere repeats-binding bouquet formation protein 1 [Crotalus tigris]|uniref:telomere repeats-binding bouquet formation protein 1 n=1 Tax=Crotalus tigris TaxID=88082 RepID=UPI00192F7830|nr:telomere repeats-binding bouquet formation protein 1 [Crotalus tigris]XP_039183357.1 telomere repeats-binding bouquet formation protein 1 [Crotalus tigris]